MEELCRLVTRHFAELAPLAAAVEAWTLWNISYRYPGEESTEPLPSRQELWAALATIDALKAALLANRPERGE